MVETNLFYCEKYNDSKKTIDSTGESSNKIKDHINNEVTAERIGRKHSFLKAYKLEHSNEILIRK